MNTKEGVCSKIILSIFFLLVLCRTAGAQDARKGILSAADAGTCTANSTACSFLTIPSGSGGVTFTITTNASANTIQFEATGDTEPTGSHTWVALNVVPSNGTTAVTSTTSTGTWQANIAGFTQVRLRCSTFVGGTTTTYINLSTASARSNGGGGSVTHTAGNLTAFHLMLGNGLADSTVDSACLTNGTGALSGCTSISAGSGASAAGATATGGFAAVEAASTGWTPTAGQDYCRADSTLHSFMCAENGNAEVLIGNVNTGQTNVYGAFLQDFAAATMKLPTAAGFTTTVNSTIGRDTTANTCKVWVNSADAICAVEATAIAAGFIPKSTDASHGLLTASLCDEAITTANAITCTDTAGIRSPAFTSTGTTAGFVDYPQGTTSAAVAPCNAATSICDQAPTAVTSYINTRPGSASSGILLNSNAGGSPSLVAQSFSGDSNHAVHVTAQTATKTIYTLCPATAGGCNVAGQYRVTWYFNQGGTACGTPTPGQVTFALSWTDNAGAHSAIALPMNDNSSIAVFTSAFKFAGTNVTGFASGEINIWSTGAQPIQVTNTYTPCGVGTGTWELTAAVEQVQ